MPTITIRTIDDQPVPAPIASVTVDIFDATGLVFITSGVTDGLGEVPFSLPAGTYVARLFKSGVSFLPSPANTLVVTVDATVQVIGHVGQVGVIATFVVKDTASPTPNPVENVRIRLFDSPADTFITELRTDANGTAEIVLEGEPSPAGKEYIVRVNTPTGYYDGPTKTIAVIDPLLVGETNVFDFVAYPPPAVPQTSDLDMCRLSGFFSDPSMRPLKNLSLIFLPVEGYPKKVISGFPFSGNPTVIRNRIVASERRVNADKNGYLEVDLPRCSTFNVFVQGLDAADHTLLGSVYVPDQAGISIHDVLFPYLVKVTFPVSALTIGVGETQELELELTASNGQPVGGKESLDVLLTVASSLPEKVVANFNTDGKISVTGVELGASTISVARVAGTYAPRRPAVPDLIIDPSFPIVTVA